MKTIIIPTDFSPAANNAARYAVHLAKETKSHLLLCNAMIVPMEAPRAGQIVWPMDTYDSLKASVDEELQTFADKLSNEEKNVSIPGSYHPVVGYKSEVGLVTDVVLSLAGNNQSNIVVMGMSGAGGLSRFLLGSKSNDMIDAATLPVILVPASFIFNGLKKIAFASDLSVGDIETIHSLVSLARCFNAEILISHVTDKNFDAYETQKLVDEFLVHVSNRMNYPKIYYRAIKNKDIDRGLSWLTEYGDIDLLAMVHRPHNTIDKFFKGSHTQKLAKQINIPLLAFPNNCCAVI